MMQPLYGGAAARPFVTHHNTLDMDLYLRIAPELYLKRLIVGGLERVYEINRNFRNEGISTQHNPEFTMLEFYQAYTDYHGLMDLHRGAAAADRARCDRLHAGEYEGVELDFGNVRRLSMREAVIEFWKGDDRPSLDNVNDPEWLKQHSGKLTAGEALADIFERIAEAQLIQPTIIYDYPVEVSPLSKNKPDDPAFVERFEIYAAGMEIGNAYTELNDPQEQRRRFEMQTRHARARRRRGAPDGRGLPARAGYGMPPTGGEGIGIDRLTMILTEFEVHPRRDSVPAAAARRRDRHGGHVCATRTRTLRGESIRTVRRRPLSARQAQAGGDLRHHGDLGRRRRGGRDGAGDRAGHQQRLPQHAAAQSAGRDRARHDAREGTRRTAFENWASRWPEAAQPSACDQASSGLYGQVFFAGPVQARGGVLKGIPLGSDQPRRTVSASEAGLARELSNSGRYPGIILGRKLAQSTGMLMDSVITVISPQGELTPMGRGRLITSFAWWECSNPASTISTTSGPSPTLSRRNRCCRLGDVVNTIELKLDDPNQAPEVAAACEKLLRPAARRPPPGWSRTVRSATRCKWSEW